VKLDDTGADGFIPARTIGDDYFVFDEAARAMIGRSTGETHRLGDHVRVKLVEAIPVAGALRFELLSEGKIGKRPRGGFSLRPRKRDRKTARQDRLPRKRRG
jgi:ribonuclease R